MNEELKQAHIDKYGSFLYCPERSVLCEHINGFWDMGCGRDEGCILDDPEYQALKRRQARNQKKLAEQEKEKWREDSEPRRYRSPVSNPEKYILAKIERLEDESRHAYRRNKPKVGERKLHEAIVLRRQLRREYNRKDV